MVYSILVLIILLFVLPLAMFSWIILSQMMEMRRTINTLNHDLKGLQVFIDLANTELKKIILDVENSRPPR